jgi:3-deoxy-manno-octulosonate cytidylyltransferase (CMP-KDO synthetase)
MTVLGIIPARFGSTRFPGKPLVAIDGKSMIQRVYDQALKAKALTKVIVATDDDRIFNHVQEFGGSVVMTGKDHQSGTDRCAEVVQTMTDKYDVAINIQGDEPFIFPEQIDTLAKCFSSDQVQIATLVKKINDVATLENTNIPKVVFNKQNQALYFSRAAIPFNRNFMGSSVWLKEYNYFKHIGIYGFRTKILKELSLLPVSGLEQTESLEQLRWLENGYSIHVAVTEFESIAIDSPSDLDRLKEYYK